MEHKREVEQELVMEQDTPMADRMAGNDPVSPDNTEYQHVLEIVTRAEVQRLLVVALLVFMPQSFMAVGHIDTSPLNVSLFYLCSNFKDVSIGDYKRSIFPNIE